jgi:hypothetical protein
MVPIQADRLQEVLGSCKSQVVLVGFGLESCLVCSHLMWTLLRVIGFPTNQSVPSSWHTEAVGVSVLWIEVCNPNDLASINLNIRLFPTLVAFLNMTPTLGWEGFAALEPSQIKEEIVRAAVFEAVSLIPAEG